MSRALNEVAGVSDVKVDLGEQQAVVSHSGVDVAVLKAAVDDAGYDVDEVG